MKNTKTSLLFAMICIPLCMFLPGCQGSGTRIHDSGAISVTGGAIPDLIRARNERLAGPLPESQWNWLKVWKRIKTSPPTYIPSGYPASSPRSDDYGCWFDDERDGKRLFVPYTAVGSYSPSALAGDAQKVTNWKYSKGKNWYDSVYHHID